LLGPTIPSATTAGSRQLLIPLANERRWRRLAPLLVTLVAATSIVGWVLPVAGAEAAATQHFHGRTSEGFAISLAVGSRSLAMSGTFRDRCSSTITDTYGLSIFVHTPRHHNAWSAIITLSNRSDTNRIRMQISFSGKHARGNVDTTDIPANVSPRLVCHGYTTFTATS
jgi:hypothetical protein